MKIQSAAAVLAILAASSGALAGAVSAQAYAVSVGGTSLYSFGIDSPGFTSFVGTISGMANGETITGIDFRPATGELYGLGSQSHLYKINTGTGAATQVGSGSFSTALNGSSFGFDFNPTVDRIRVTSNANQNMRLHPVSGVVAATDLDLHFANNDSPFVVGSAYTNSFAGATSTTLFDIDSRNNSLLRQAPPNDGVVTTVGGLGVDFTADAGFDIFGPNGYAILNTENGAFSGFYQIDLSTGASTFLGEVGDFSRGTIFFGSLAIIPAPGAAGMGALVGLVAIRRRR